MNSHKLLRYFSPLICTVALSVQASLPDCEKSQTQRFEKNICTNESLKQLNSQLKEKFLATQLMSNASLPLLSRSQEDWLKFVKLCKNNQCIQQQFEQRLDDLTFIINMNQSLTQHYIRYLPHRTQDQMVTIQLQQLDKDRIKIESMQYRNPNNSEHKRIAYLRSYTSPQLQEEITDLETKCVYSLIRFKHILEFKTEDPKCKRFAGIYKLYD